MNVEAPPGLRRIVLPTDQMDDRASTVERYSTSYHSGRIPFNDVGEPKIGISKDTPLQELPENSSVPNAVGPGIADPMVFHALRTEFVRLQQLVCKDIARLWIRIVEPKKRVTYPYSNASVKPCWWPEHISHIQPDHLPKHERVDLLVHLIISYPEHRPSFWETSFRVKQTVLRRAILRTIFDLADGTVAPKDVERRYDILRFTSDPQDPVPDHESTSLPVTRTIDDSSEDNLTDSEAEISSLPSPTTPKRKLITTIDRDYESQSGSDIEIPKGRDKIARLHADHKAPGSSAPVPTNRDGGNSPISIESIQLRSSPNTRYKTFAETSFSSLSAGYAHPPVPDLEMSVKEVLQPNLLEHYDIDPALLQQMAPVKTLMQGRRPPGAENPQPSRKHLSGSGALPSVGQQNYTAMSQRRYASTYSHEGYWPPKTHTPVIYGQIGPTPPTTPNSSWPPPMYYCVQPQIMVPYQYRLESSVVRSLGRDQGPVVRGRYTST